MRSLLYAAFLLLSQAAGGWAERPGYTTVLLYHRFDESAYPSTNISVDKFRQQMQYLRDNEYRVLSMEAFRQLLSSGEPFPQKTVLITIDDAYRSIYERAFPVLKEFDYPFTVFADAKRLYSNAPGALTWAMVEEMRAWGATVANHSYDHPRIGRPQKGHTREAYAAWVRQDLSKAQQALADHGMASDVLAYPYGEYNEVVVELPIKHPELFESLGIAQPKGVILYGPPGTGKTLLARAVAHHTDCCFIRVSGSELVQKYIGEGARMVRELFVMARENAPAILFMDEVDSIGSARGSGGGDSEVQRTMLELLNQLDGFEASNQIKVIMATNRLDILDGALLRPGRIDRKIEFPNPTEDSRVDILKIHSRKMNLVRGIDLKKIASKMGGASGAESKAVCTEAGMFALRERRVHVTQEDFEMAVSKVMQKDSEKNVSVTKLFV